MFTDSKILNLSKDYKYIHLDENDSPCVANVEIHQLIEDKDIHKWSVQKIRKMYHSSFAQIHSVLAFYFDNEEEEKDALKYGGEYSRRFKPVDGINTLLLMRMGFHLSDRLL
jgi:hypothetical protein